jgi:hypothetical protein
MPILPTAENEKRNENQVAKMLAYKYQNVYAVKFNLPDVNY